MRTTRDEGPAGGPEVWEALGDVMSSVPAQADLLPKVIDSVRPQAAALVSSGFPAVDRAFLVGCGDSYYAAYGAQGAFERLTGLDTVAMEAMEFARYKAPFIGPESLVIPISNGGQVMRTLEAAEVANEAGSSVILVTARPDSPFGRLGLPTINQYAEPDEGSSTINALGLVNYMASFTTLILVGLELARARGRSSDRERLNMAAALGATPELIRSTVHLHLTTLRDWARSTPLRSLFVLGAGPSFGAAQFVGAKFFEAPQFAASVQQLEEWAHEQFFTHRSGRQVMIIAPSGPSAGRAVEILEGIQRIGGIGIVVSDDVNLLAAADLALRIPTTEAGEGLSPLVSVVPGEILAIAYQEVAGRLEATDPELRELQHQLSHRQIGESVRLSLSDLR
jgi:glucosamine--fructose-6-phosphate aminotransferase (isomerizing)